MRLSVTACAFIVAAHAVAAAQTTAVPPTSIAVISGQRISAETAIGKAAQGRLQTFQRQKAAELQGRQDALTALRVQLAEATDPAARSALQKQVVTQQTEFDRAGVQAQLDLQTLQRQINGELQARVHTALSEILKGRNIAVVLQQEPSVLWVAPGLDLTGDVIAWMSRNPAETATPPAR